MAARKDKVTEIARTFATASGEYSAKLDPETVMQWAQVMMQLIIVFKACRQLMDNETEAQAVQRMAKNRQANAVFVTRRAVRREGLVRGRRNIIRVADSLLEQIADSDEAEIVSVLEASDTR